MHIAHLLIDRKVKVKVAKIQVKSHNKMDFVLALVLIVI